MRRDGAYDGGLDAAVEGAHAALLANELAEFGDHPARGRRGGGVAPSLLPAGAMLGVLPGVERHERIGGEEGEEGAARAGDGVERGVGVGLHATAVNVRETLRWRERTTGRSWRGARPG